MFVVRDALQAARDLYVTTCDGFCRALASALPQYEANGIVDFTTDPWWVSMTSYLKASLWLFAAAPHVPERCLSSPKEEPADLSRVVLDVDTLDALASNAGCKEYVEVQYTFFFGVQRERPFLRVHLRFQGFTFLRVSRQILEIFVMGKGYSLVGANPRDVGDGHLELFLSCFAHERLKRGNYDSHDLFRFFSVLFFVARTLSLTSGARSKNRVVRCSASGEQEMWCSIKGLFGARRPTDTPATSSKTSEMRAVMGSMATWCWIEVELSLKGRGHDTTVLSNLFLCASFYPDFLQLGSFALVMRSHFGANLGVQ